MKRRELDEKMKNKEEKRRIKRNNNIRKKKNIGKIDNYFGYIKVLKCL